MTRILPPAILFALNLIFVRRLLTLEYLAQMGSIEGAYIGIARWASANWGDLTWFPLWYGGIPYQHTYPPLLHLIVAGVSTLFKLSAAHSHHLVTAIFYSLGPVTLYWLSLRLCGSRIWSFAAGLFYSLISTSNFLISVVRNDAGGWWGPRRLQVLVEYGEGPHVAALALLPAAVALLSLAFEKKKPLWWLASAISIASVALTNWFGGAALAIAVPALLLARGGTGLLACLQTGGVCAAAYLIASPWLPPSTIHGIWLNEKLVRTPLAALPVRLLAVAAALTALTVLLWLFRRFDTPRHIRFALLFLLPTAAITLLQEWFGVAVAAQASRYHLEMEMALALAVVFIAREALRRCAPRTQLAIGCAVLLLSVYPAYKVLRHARSLIHPVVIQDTIEYREARWFDENMQGRRVFAPGSIGFFLNAFADTPQLAGGFDPGVLNRSWGHVQYQILSGDDAGEREGEIALTWLRAFGVDAVAVSGPRSREAFRPFKNPKKFDGLLAELWRDGDDVIYRVPRRSASLAHVVRPRDLPPRAPVNGIDMEPVRPYLAALEDHSLPVATFVWRDRHTATITTSLQPDQVLSVQISYHHGWNAKVGGMPRRVYGDNLGQLVVEPRCDGTCIVELTYDGGTEMLLCRLVSWVCLGFGLLWTGWGILHRRRLPLASHLL